MFTPIHPFGPILIFVARSRWLPCNSDPLQSPPQAGSWRRCAANRSSGCPLVITSCFRGLRRFHNYETEYASGLPGVCCFSSSCVLSATSLRMPLLFAATMPSGLKGAVCRPVFIRQLRYSSRSFCGRSLTDTSRPPFSRSARCSGLRLHSAQARRCSTMSMAA